MGFQDCLLYLRLEPLLANELGDFALFYPTASFVGLYVLRHGLEHRVVLEVRIRNQNIDVFEVVLMNRRGDLRVFVIELEPVEDSLLLELDFPGRAADAVARRHCRYYQLSVFDFESLVLVEGNELDIPKGSLYIL